MHKLHDLTTPSYAPKLVQKHIHQILENGIIKAYFFMHSDRASKAWADDPASAKLWAGAAALSKASVSL